MTAEANDLMTVLSFASRHSNDSEALMTADNSHGLDHDKAAHLNICGFAALGDCQSSVVLRC